MNYSLTLIKRILSRVESILDAVEPVKETTDVAERMSLCYYEKQGPGRTN
jgi:hypothetical protein